MIKPNYSAWHIDQKSFTDGWADIKKLQFFAKYAVLSPSGHNTQPWHFSHQKQSLLLKINRNRLLPFSGSLTAEPYISLGACLESLILAARGFGYELIVECNLKNDLVATIKIGNKIKPEPTLLDALTSRTSNRNNFKTAPLAQEILNSITNSDLQNTSIETISDKKDVEFMATQTEIATATMMTEAKFREELSKWVRNNLTKKHDGMPGFVQGMPTPPSLIARHVIKRIDISKGQAKKDANSVRHSSALALISAKNYSELAFLNAGRLYARICVLGAQQGIASSGVIASTADSNTRKNIKDRFNLTYRPIALIRLGIATKPARHTPRWPLEKVSD